MFRTGAWRALAATVLAVAGTASCSDHDTAFCAALRRSSSSFDAGVPIDRTIHQIDVVASQLAPADRSDILAVRDLLAASAHPEHYSQSTIIAVERRFVATVPHLDARLRLECGTPLDRAVIGVAFDAPATTTTTTPATTGG